MAIKMSRDPCLLCDKRLRPEGCDDEDCPTKLAWESEHREMRERNTGENVGGKSGGKEII